MYWALAVVDSGNISTGICSNCSSNTPSVLYWNTLAFKWQYIKKEKENVSYYCGIDVGKSGAITLISDNEDQIFTYKIPLVNNEIDLQKLSSYINFWSQYIKHCVIEDVHSIFGVGAKSNFQFGRALGIVEAMCSIKQIPITKITAKNWQKVAFVGIPTLNKPGQVEKGRGKIDTKAMATLAAQRLFPNLSLTKSLRAKKPDSGIVDALLIAYYCKQTFSK